MSNLRHPVLHKSGRTYNSMFGGFWTGQWSNGCRLVGQYRIQRWSPQSAFVDLVFGCEKEGSDLPAEFLAKVREIHHGWHRPIH